MRNHSKNDVVYVFAEGRSVGKIECFPEYLDSAIDERDSGPVDS